MQCRRILRAVLLMAALTTSLPVLWTLASGDTEKDIAEGEKLLAELSGIRD